MERKNINKKGFTLIELLAVIVILAIVTVAATRTLLPIFANSGRDGFAINANEVRNVSADLISLYTFKKNEIKTKDIIDQLDTISTGGTACITIDQLKSEGLIKIGDDFAGAVRIKTSGAGYAYYVNMYNKDSGYYVQQCVSDTTMTCTEGSVEGTDDDVKTISGTKPTTGFAQPDATFDCPSD